MIVNQDSQASGFAKGPFIMMKYSQRPCRGGKTYLCPFVAGQLKGSQSHAPCR